VFELRYALNPLIEIDEACGVPKSISTLSTYRDVP